MNTVITIIVLAIVAITLYGVFVGVRRSRGQMMQKQETLDLEQLVTPQDLSSLAQPYRTLMGEAVQIHRDVAERAAKAPSAMQTDLTLLAHRIGMLVTRAMPRARHGTELSEYLLELSPSEPQYAQTQGEATKVEEELNHFLDTLKTLRGSLYQALTGASNLTKDTYLTKDLQDALLEVEGLEAAFKETSELDMSPVDEKKT
jgi:type II secretory pathway pseudopilin PulG